MVTITRILCPVDFSGPSRLALQTAAKLALECDAELVIAHVWESPMHPDYSEEIIHNELLAHVLKDEEAELAALKKEALDLGACKVTAKLIFVEECRNDPTYDVIVMGTHGRTGIKHVLLGSVAERVAQHASCPVLLVREHARAGDELAAHAG